VRLHFLVVQVAEEQQQQQRQENNGVIQIPESGKRQNATV
jgi:hypothetical protein